MGRFLGRWVDEWMGGWVNGWEGVGYIGTDSFERPVQSSITSYSQTMQTK